MRKPWLTGGIVLLVAGVLLALVMALMLVLRPHTYAATARIYVATKSPTPSRVIETMQSQPVLVAVVRNLGLATAWSPKTLEPAMPIDLAVDRLRQKLLIQLSPATALIEIRAEAENPEEAAAIANGLIVATRASLMSETSNARAMEVIEKAVPNPRRDRTRRPHPWPAGSIVSVALISVGVLLLVAGARLGVR